MGLASEDSQLVPWNIPRTSLENEKATSEAFLLKKKSESWASVLGSNSSPWFDNFDHTKRDRTEVQWRALNLYKVENSGRPSVHGIADKIDGVW